MKDLAVVKLTKSLFGSVGKKIADKKQKWKQEAALSVEETKRREAEFKEDFAKVTGKKSPEVLKKERQTDIKETSKDIPQVQESIKVGESKKETTKTITAEKVATKKTETTASPAKAKKEVSTKKKTTSKSKEPSKKEVKLALYSENIKKYYGKVDEDFLAIVVKNLGPSIYKKDAELVSCSDPKELDTVRKNFLIKKLEMKESADVLNKAIKEVCTELKASRNKYRATFYYALAKKFNLESKLS